MTSILAFFFTGIRPLFLTNQDARLSDVEREFATRSLQEKAESLVRYANFHTLIPLESGRIPPSNIPAPARRALTYSS
jgi:hypothetical protein